ncbi:threonine ammonia-lyase, biosynthetic [Intrasporangium calvum]|uniref:L-threonine dehydratase n=1 Tax=Intrasporangium calvum (strain ATCC 23552 / DSM 43043 / JCM 3097 / NBRC 12989 / NCIMB 10167 / NRRL B-3866 / 7 KIP) TaxID=710696 RepID=E6S6N0_INTC7|nr:threonine dehydratase, biosynthetic [Intrasporangium calvum DSM 43043]
MVTKGGPAGANGADLLRDVLRAPVYEAAVVTPLEVMESLSERLDNIIEVKREDRQPVHSFKIRGAYTRMRALTPDETSRGVIAASAGNHAQGVALSAALLGIEAVLVMPVTTAPIKVDAVRSHGATVVLFGDTFDEAKAEALGLAEEHGHTYIAPFDDPLVIAGQGTIGLELIQQDAHLDRVFVPVGGGGLAAGVAGLIKNLMPGIQVIGVEPEDAACLTAALAAGHPVELAEVSRFAEGVAVKRVGDTTFAMCRDFLDDVVTVDSDEICAAIKDIFEDVRAVAEPAGAVALAGLKKYVDAHEIRGERLAHVLSGANVNFHSLRYISERAEVGEHREALYGVTIPERAGSFLEFLRVLRGRAVTEFNYRVDGSSEARIFVGVQLVRGAAERTEIAEAMARAGYPVIDLSEDDTAKTHVRYMIGGHPPELREQVYSFEFPEHPGALSRFLTQLGTRWNITMFHYRSHGADYGRVLCAFEGVSDDADFHRHVEALGYPYRDVTTSPALSYFLLPR